MLHTKVKLGNSDKIVILAVADRIPDQSCDVLAITLPAMEKLSASSRSFFVLEDFFPLANSYNAQSQLAKKIDDWLDACDLQCERHLGVQKAFSDNGYWFLNRLNDLNYIHHVLDEIETYYEKIELWTEKMIPDLVNPKVDFSSLNMLCFGVGLQHLIQFMKLGFNNSEIVVSSLKKFDINQVMIQDQPLNYLIWRFPEIVTRNGARLWQSLVRKVKKKKRLFWVVQGGYDSEILANIHLDCEFENIRKKEVHYALECKNNNTRLMNTLIDESNKLLEDAFPRFNDWLKIWIDEYCNNVVFKLKSYEINLEKRMRMSNVEGLLYSSGSQSVLEGSLLRIANKLNIPCFFFKHSGIDSLFRFTSNHDKYFERNCMYKRQQFIHSELEIDFYKNSKFVSPVLSGPLSKVKSPSSSTLSRKKIIYAVGVPEYYNFKEVNNLTTEHQRFIFASCLIKTCAHLNLDLTIKVHPIEWKINMEFFSRLIASHYSNKKNLKLISGGSIDSLLHKFGLLVLDVITTRVLAVAIGLDMPIILYVPKHFLANEKTYPDLKKRCYIVHNKDDLEEIISIYNSNGLSSKYDKKFAKKYLHGNDVDKALRITSDQIFARNHD